MSNTAIKSLAEDMRLGGVTEDPFTWGDMLRWITASGYTYSAIKTPVGWYTSATSDNMYVRQRYSYIDLVKMLVREKPMSLEMAINWREVL